MSYLEVITKVDNFPYGEDPGYYKLLSHDRSAILGYIEEDIAARLAEELWFHIERSEKTVTFDSKLDIFEKRNEVLKTIAEKWRKLPYFSDSLDKAWRNELYVVYNPTHTPYVLVERALSVLIGVVTYGVHINGYIPASKTSNKKLKLWVPRRSKTKQTYPLMLDNTIAGGIGFPNGIGETVIKECFEEGHLSAEFVKLHIKPTGVVLYMYQPKGAQGNVQPEVEYTYDLEFDNETDVIPRPEDGEVESFVLMDSDEVLKRLYRNEFKPNCGLIIIDFLIRHGYITPDIEPNYSEIVSRCHRKLPFPTL
ncbi:uncharacterized protein PRCAT00002758001 [Priceomyces carsonii]|uniref:uncharacterized protein n=1 Tax=Priceomyces carsonii TaxID=28549 RepID=UPI002ED9AA78|nr:unnamed protein product [Priceomyces carsonii]